MPYKISGTLNDSARLLVVDENTWSVEFNESVSLGDYVIDPLVSGTKWVTARNVDGFSISYGKLYLNSTLIIPGVFLPVVTLLLEQPLLSM